MAEPTLPKVDTPTTMVIFGATGDLASNYLLPTLMKLMGAGLLPSKFRLVGVSRSEQSDTDFGEHIVTALKEHKAFDESAAKQLAATASHFAADMSEQGWGPALTEHLNECPREQVVYYLSTAPSLFPIIIEELGASNLNKLGERVALIVEKPFGHSLESARELNKVIDAHFDEHQVYRMDHYLGKDTVQNLVAFRFENGLFEPSWNTQFIDHVQITIAYGHGIRNRGRYYEESGALRDAGQNHLLQLLAHIAMEPPASLSADDLRDARAAVLKQLKPPTTEDLANRVIRGQYTEGRDFYGHDAKAYRDEKHVDAGSNVETFVAMPIYIDTPRWKDVPFFVRTGMRMERTVTEITIQFKPSPHDLYHKKQATANLLTFRIQPNEGIALRLAIKEPGYETRLEDIDMSFCYRNQYEGKLPEAYDRLLLDCLRGQQSLFARTDEIEAEWVFVDSIRKYWEAHQQSPLHYAAGSWGPAEADSLIADHGAQWWGNILDICPVPGASQVTEVTPKASS